jgi:ABC-type transporter Mla MlaB component
VKDLRNWSTGVPIGMELGSHTEGWSNELPSLQIELLEDTSGGCLARMSGHLIGQTAAALWSIEPMMANEARVVLDLSGVVAIDSAGLEATIRLMDAIRAFGGTLTIGGQALSVEGVAQSARKTL